MICVIIITATRRLMDSKKEYKLWCFRKLEKAIFERTFLTPPLQRQLSWFPRLLLEKRYSFVLRDKADGRRDRL